MPTGFQKVLKSQDQRSDQRSLTLLTLAILKAIVPQNPPPHNTLQNGIHFGEPLLMPQSQNPVPVAVAASGIPHLTQTPRHTHSLPHNEKLWAARGVFSVDPPLGTGGIQAGPGVKAVNSSSPPPAGSIAKGGHGGEVAPRSADTPSHKV